MNILDILIHFHEYCLVLVLESLSHIIIRQSIFRKKSAMLGNGECCVNIPKGNDEHQFGREGEYMFWFLCCSSKTEYRVQYFWRHLAIFIAKLQIDDIANFNFEYCCTVRSWNFSKDPWFYYFYGWIDLYICAPIVQESFLCNFKALEPELCITAAYGNILPTKFLKIPTMG